MEGDPFDQTGKGFAILGAEPLGKSLRSDTKGVRLDISERVIGHVISGVEGVFDWHSYLDEKQDVLEKMAAMIDQIIGES